VRSGSALQVAYFDQHRATLREDWNAVENVAEGRESVTINGRQKYVIGYLQDFLFTAERARAPITRLSGGERNRLLLARLFAQPSNLLVMDEPTNDLDVETLELLEELLSDYAGTLLLVSHDRDFLDNVVTSTLAREGDDTVGEYVGGYSDWLRQRPAPSATEQPSPAGARLARDASPSRPTPARKLAWKQQRELEQLPARIEQLESKVATLTETMADPAFYERDSAAITAHTTELSTVQADLDAAYARWEELETMRASS
jgi:ATP-binding cassette subfamily F protein uup